MNEQAYNEIVNMIELFYSSKIINTQDFISIEQNLRTFFSSAQSWIHIAHLLSNQNLSPNVLLFLFTQLHKKLIFGFEAISTCQNLSTVRELLVKLLQNTSNTKINKYCSKCLAIFSMHTMSIWKEVDCIESIIKDMFINKDKISLSFQVLGVIYLSGSNIFLQR